jgi:hypothetical protein
MHLPKSSRRKGQSQARTASRRSWVLLIAIRQLVAGSGATITRSTALGKTNRAKREQEAIEAGG